MSYTSRTSTATHLGSCWSGKECWRTYGMSNVSGYPLSLIPGIKYNMKTCSNIGITSFINDIMHLSVNQYTRAQWFSTSVLPYPGVYPFHGCCIYNWYPYVGNSHTWLDIAFPGMGSIYGTAWGRHVKTRSTVDLGVTAYQFQEHEWSVNSYVNCRYSNHIHNKSDAKGRSQKMTTQMPGCR
jgi:hypothetical protein